MKTRIVFVLLLIFSVLITAIFLFRQCVFNNDASCRIFKEKRIRVGYAIEPPYAYFDKQGNLTGESIELCRFVCDSLGIDEIDWQLMDFGMLIQSLQSSEIDMIASGLFITPERVGKVSFSTPTFRVCPGILHPEGDFCLLDSIFADGDSSFSLEMAVLSGSFEQSFLSEVPYFKGVIKEYPDAQTARLSVNQGLADCLVLSLPTLRWMKRDNLGFDIKESDFLDSLAGLNNYGIGGFAFNKHDEELLEAFNEILFGIVGSEQHLNLIRSFGFTKKELTLPSNMRH